MKRVEMYAQGRRAVYVEGISQREAARRFGIDPRTVAKMLAFSVPPGYRRSRPPARPKLDPFTGIIDGILAADEGRPRKQRHTSKRIFERLRDEHGYSGGITIVKDYVLSRRLRQREVFVPLRHDPGHAQVDFGEALAEIAGVERKVHFFAIDLPQRLVPLSPVVSHLGAYNLSVCILWADLSGQSRNDGVFGEAAASSDGGAASAGEIVAIGAEDAFDDAEMEQTGELSGKRG